MNDQVVPAAVAPPPGNPRFELLDAVRAIAALSVLVFHVAIFSGFSFHGGGEYTSRLDFGVTLFFVLSGFLLYRPFVAGRLDGRPAPHAARYARRRALRILPAYWLALTVLAIWPGLGGDVFDDPLRYYLFLQTTSPATVVTGIPVAWSLCVEVSFYIALPFYAIAVARWLHGRARDRQVFFELVLLALLATVSVAARAYGHEHAATVLLFSLPVFLYWFALGMGLAVVSAWLAPRTADRQPRVVRAIAAHPWIPWLLAGIAFWAVATRFAIPRFGPESLEQTLAQHLLYGLVSLFIVLPAVFGGDAGGWPRRLLANRVLAWIGLISYGVYLWHITIVDQLKSAHFARGSAVLPTAGLLVGTVALTFACAAASYYVVERRALRFKDWPPGRGSRGTAPAAPPAPRLGD